MTHDNNNFPKFEIGEPVAFLEEHISGWNSQIRKKLIRDIIKTVGKDKIIMESGRAWSRKVDNYYGAGKQTYTSNFKTSLISKDYADHIAIEIKKANEEHKIFQEYMKLGDILRDARSLETARKILQEFKEPKDA